MNTITKGKPQKKAKETAGFGTEPVDNNAPVSKILEDLRHKNFRALGFYFHVLRPRAFSQERNTPYHYSLTGHPIQVFSDDWDGGLNSGYFEKFSYKSLMPKIITSVQNIDKADPVVDIMKIKMKWHKQNKDTFQYYRKKLLDNYENFNDEVARCPKEIVNIAAHMDNDPDPYFNESYNWYYAGNGNILPICIDWMDYCLHSQLNILYLTRYFSQDSSLNKEHTATFACENGENILETIASTNNIVALRTKHKIIILKIVYGKDILVFEKLKAIESELPFTAITFDGHHKNILYITNLNNTVNIVNLDRLTGRTVKLTSRIKSLAGNWNAVLSSDRLTYTHVTRQKISTYDKRSNTVVDCWNDVREITDYVNCNDISIAKLGDENTSLYFATDHHLFLMDLRYQNKSKPKVVSRWTHGMQCIPTYMSIGNFEFNKELICLSSQWCEDVCVVPSYKRNSLKQTESPGVTVPYRLPSILSTFREAKEKSLCWDLYNPLDTRLSTSITGLMLLDNGENFSVLVQNSLGDISNCTLYQEHMESFVNQDNADSLHEWSKSYKLQKTEFEISSILDISELWKSLKKVPATYNFVSNVTTHVNSKVIQREIEEIFEKKLDNGLLDVWWNDRNDTTKMEDSSLALNLHYSNDDSSSE